MGRGASPRLLWNKDGRDARGKPAALLLFQQRVRTPLVEIVGRKRELMYVQAGFTGGETRLKNQHQGGGAIDDNRLLARASVLSHPGSCTYTSRRQCVSLHPHRAPQTSNQPETAAR